MKLPNQLDKEFQQARVYRGIAVLLELTAIYVTVYGIYIAITSVASWL